MMGREQQNQPQLFYPGFNLEKRVRQNHPLRRVNELLDLTFIYNEVRDLYGYNGNVSIPPPEILKMMLLLVFYNVRSERELMDTLPERLDWLWFMGYDIDTKIPDHSVLSKARQRWGVEIFRTLFERVVWQCVEAGLVDGTKIFMDSSLIEADASNNSVVDRQSLKRYLNESYLRLEERLEDKSDDDDGGEGGGGSGEINQRYISTTDPEASVVRHGKGRSKLKYKTHRAIDSANGVITATEATNGGVNEAHRLTELVDQHQENTHRGSKVVVADSMYGTKDNYLRCYDLGIKAHIPDLKKKQDRGKRRSDIFPMESFIYNEDTDTYICPQGKRLKRRTKHGGRGSSDYGASKKACRDCPVRTQCTTSKTGRTINRDDRQDELDRMRAEARSAESKLDISTRQHFMERSFAEGKRYGLKRARWRKLWRVRIQDYMIAMVQNLNIMVRRGNKFKNVVSVELAHLGRNLALTTRRIFQLLLDGFLSSFSYIRILRPVFAQ